MKLKKLLSILSLATVVVFAGCSASGDQQAPDANGGNKAEPTSGQTDKTGEADTSSKDASQKDAPADQTK